MAAEVDQLRLEIRQELTQLREQLAVFENQQKEIIKNMSGQVATEVNRVASGIQELYGKASNAIDN